MFYVYDSEASRFLFLRKTVHITWQSKTIAMQSNVLFNPDILIKETIAGMNIWILNGKNIFLAAREQL